jgi:UDP-MurNAc hydroxylase
VVVVRVTTLGHAGLLIEARNGKTVLCDPWFGPAFAGAWFPFPDNSWLRPLITRQPDFLYVSHNHADHFDRAFCAEVDKETPVILPSYPLRELEQELRALGFTDFIRTSDGEQFEIGGLKMVVFSNSSPSDGPMGDSALMVDDGSSRIFNQNDSRPHDLELVKSYGPYDVHFAQHSGAVWYPVVYNMPAKAKAMAGARKRHNQLRRFLHYVDTVDAKYVVPNSGPPAFLDPKLFHLNDLGDDDSNVFPDQMFTLEHLGFRGRLMTPGSVMDVTQGRTTGRPASEAFGMSKPRYLEAYAKREEANFEPELQTVPDLYRDLFLKMSFLIRHTNLIAKGINGLVVIDWGEESLGLDFRRKVVGYWDREPFVHRLTFEKKHLEDLVARDVPNWVDDFWPSCRFVAERRGGYNDYVGSFFRCLTLERLKYAEAWFAQGGDEDWWTVDGWRIQRRCPHARADLARMGSIEGNVLTCSSHGLRFNLETGECLDETNLTIQAERADGLR